MPPCFFVSHSTLCRRTCYTHACLYVCIVRIQFHLLKHFTHNKLSKSCALLGLSISYIGKAMCVWRSTGYMRVRSCPCIHGACWHNTMCPNPTPDPLILQAQTVICNTHALLQMRQGKAHVCTLHRSCQLVKDAWLVHMLLGAQGSGALHESLKSRRLNQTAGKTGKRRGSAGTEGDRWVCMTMLSSSV